MLAKAEEKKAFEEYKRAKREAKKLISKALRGSSRFPKARKENGRKKS